MERTLDDVRGPLRLRKTFGGLALVSLLLCFALFLVARLLPSGDTLPWGVMSAIRSTLATGIIFSGGHTLLALVVVLLVNLAVRREEEAWVIARGGQLVLVWKPADLNPLKWSSTWWCDQEGLMTVSRERHAWRDLQRVTTTRRRATTTLNVLLDYTVVRTVLQFASGTALARLDSSRLGGAQGRRARAFTEALTARVGSVTPVVKESRGFRWMASETLWDGASPQTSAPGPTA